MYVVAVGADRHRDGPGQSGDPVSAGVGEAVLEGLPLRPEGEAEWYKLSARDSEAFGDAFGDTLASRPPPPDRRPSR